MPSKLRDVTREFALGAATLGTWRAAARAEPFDRALADEILTLISEWENTAWPDMSRARTALRAHAERLAPPAPPPDASASRRNQDPTAAMYEAGLRGQRRQG